MLDAAQAAPELKLADLPEEERIEIIGDVNRIAIRARRAWVEEARPNQIPPPGEWTTLLWMAGRFFGKSRCLSEAAWWEAFRVPGIRIHIVAPTIGDVRRVTMEGESGILAKMPAELKLSYNRSLHELNLTNGSLICGFSATEEADRLRGPQCHMLLFDEAAAADRPPGNLEIAYKVASLGCRLPYRDGTPSRKLIATTPKPIQFLRNLIKRPDVLTVRGTSFENLKNVAPSIRSELMALEGTQFGRQEVYGELLDETQNAIFKRNWFRLWPKDKPLPEFAYIAVSLDPAVSEHDYNVKRQTTDPTGCGVFGVFNTKQCFTEEQLRTLQVRSKYAVLLCDYWEERLGFPELLERVRDISRTKFGGDYRTRKNGRKPDIVIIEAEKTGISLRQALAKYNVPSVGFKTLGQSKTMRAHIASPFVLQGMLFIPESKLPERAGKFRDWADVMVDQMCSFAGEGTTEHDEGVDVCVGPETKVITSLGLVRADEVRPGDFVLTHKGRWRPITSVTARKVPGYYRLKGKGLDEIRITGNHRVLAMTIAASQRKGKEAREIKWVRVDELNVRPTMMVNWKGYRVRSQRRVIHHGLVLPRTNQELPVCALDIGVHWVDKAATVGATRVRLKHGRSKPVSRHIDLNYEAGWAFGLFAAEGCVVATNIIWACDQKALNRVAKWCKQAFGRTSKPQPQTSIWRLTLGSKVAATVFSEFGHMAPNKRLPHWAYHAPSEFKEGFIDGYTHGDGHVWERRSGNKATTITSTSLSMLWGLKLLLASLGRYSTVCQTKAGGVRRVFEKEYECLPAYGLSFADGKKNWTAVSTEDYQGLYVELAEPVNEEIVVYDLSIEEDESFVTTGGTLHNCTQVLLELYRMGLFDLIPRHRELPDPDEEEDRKTKEAVAIADREKRAKKGNPYGV